MSVMGFLVLLIAWIALFIVAWPVALVLLVAMPLLWFLALPFRIVFILLEAVVALFRALVFLPARIIGYR